MEVINLFDQRSTIFKLRLRQLYRRLDSTSLPWEIDRQTRLEFFIKAQSEFFHVLRLKKQIPDAEVANFLCVTQQQLTDIEEGRMKVTDREFFLLCTFLGGANEVSKFLEKLECSMQPGLREARKSAHETLKAYGIQFADDDIGK